MAVKIAWHPVTVKPEARVSTTDPFANLPLQHPPNGGQRMVVGGMLTDAPQYREDLLHDGLFIILQYRRRFLRCSGADSDRRYARMNLERRHIMSHHTSGSNHSSPVNRHSRRYRDAGSEPDIVFQSNTSSAFRRRLPLNGQVAGRSMIAGHQSAELTDQAACADRNISATSAQIVILTYPGASSDHDLSESV